MGRELPNLGRQNHPNLWIAQCKLCGYGVYRGQEYVWLSYPIGRSHLSCARERGLA